MNAGRINRAVVIFSFAILVLSTCSPLLDQAIQSPTDTAILASPTLALSGIPTIEPTLATLQVSLYPSGARTEIAELDVIIDAVLAHDFEALRGLTGFTITGCTHNDGLGGPPKCAPEESEGTPIEVVPFHGPEGHHLRRADYQQWSGPDALGLLAVYQVSSSAYSDGAYPAGEYALVFLEASGATILTLQVHQGRVVRYDYDLGGSIVSIIQRDAEEIILAFTPRAVPTQVPWNRFTDAGGRFTFLYPPSLSIEAGLTEETWRLGEQIEVVVQGPGISWITCFDEALGDCPMVETDDVVSIQGHEARRVKGWFGAVGGRIPQEFLVYIFDLDDHALVFTLFALAFDAEVNDYSIVWPVEGMALELFERTVDTVTISE